MVPTTKKFKVWKKWDMDKDNFLGNKIRERANDRLKKGKLKLKKKAALSSSCHNLKTKESNNEINE